MSTLSPGPGFGVASGQPPSFMDLNDPLMKQVVENVRYFMRDYTQLNRLTKGMDHNDRHIAWAVLDTLSDWASTPPFILPAGLGQIIGRGWQNVFIRGVAISLLESLMFLHMRNFISYSDGGVNVQTENPQMLQAALQMMKSEYEQKKQRALVSANIEGALGSGSGVHSEYAYVNSFWGAF